MFVFFSDRLRQVKMFFIQTCPCSNINVHREWLYENLYFQTCSEETVTIRILCYKYRERNSMHSNRWFSFSLCNPPNGKLKEHAENMTDHLALNAPIATKVVCFFRLLKCLRSLYGKQCGPRSDCSYMCSLSWVHAVCFYT